MTWKAYHRRGEVLREVVAAVEERRDGRLPTDVPGVTSCFADDLDLVATLQLKWHTRLAGRIDAALAAQPLDLEEAVVSAWAETAGLMPGVRRVLDEHLAHPVDDDMATALAKATAKERVLLAMMAGRASVQDWSAVPMGARLEERARRRYDAVQAGPATTVGAGGDRPRTLLGRLRALVAA